jgi:uncharacterized protein YkwD
MRVVASLSCAACTALSLAAAPAAHAASPRTGATERAIVRSINHRRAHHGLAPVRIAPRLALAADFHTREMLSGNYFAHTSLHGGSFTARIHHFARARAVGETLAWMSRCGRHAGRRIVSLWMHSPPHRAILLSGRFHRVGIGLRTGSLGGGRVCVVTGDFAR